ncbi:hypothetical protein Plhal304r1_c021g0074161 [Plasmopara halstedii]
MRSDATCAAQSREFENKETENHDVCVVVLERQVQNIRGSRYGYIEISACRVISSTQRGGTFGQLTSSDIVLLIHKDGLHFRFFVRCVR